MYNVSNAYKQQIAKKVRNKSYVRIVIYDEDYNSTTKTGTELLRIDTSQSSSIKLFNCIWSREIDQLSTKLPDETFEFTFIDDNMAYNPENPSSLWDSVEKQVPIAFWFGYQLDDNSIEWVKGSTYITSGQNDFSVENGIALITIKSSSVISFLINEIALDIGADYTLFSGTYNAIVNGIIEESLSTVLNWFNLYIQTTSQNSAFIALDEAMTEQEFLQYASQAMAGTLKTNDTGDIIIANYKSTPESLTIDFGSFVDFPQCHKFPKLSVLEIGYYPITLGELSEEHSMWRTQPSGTSVYTYDSWDYKSWTVGNSDLIGEIEISSVMAESYSGSSRYGAFDHIRDMDGNVGRLSISADKKTIEGYFHHESGYYYIEVFFRYRPVMATLVSEKTQYLIEGYGEPCALQNRLISESNVLLQFKNNAEYYLKLRNQYNNVPYRGNPELDTGDIITVQTIYNDSIKALVFKNEIIFDGTLSGDISFYTIPNEDEEEE